MARSSWGGAGQGGPDGVDTGWRNSERSATWQRPTATRAPVPAALSRSPVASRVLPKPASPDHEDDPGVAGPGALPESVQLRGSALRPTIVGAVRVDGPSAPGTGGPAAGEAGVSWSSAR